MGAKGPVKAIAMMFEILILSDGLGMMGLK